MSIDDFGTGYSSLSYLQNLPIDHIKIDRSFIKELTDESGKERKGAIILAVIAMAQSLKLEVIAEGVETSDQLSFLTDNGCDQVQGYLFSRPCPAAQVDHLFDQDLLETEGAARISAA